MIILKLGTLAVRTIAKPIASRIKHGAGLHPKFREFIVDLAQVAGIAIICEVQRNSRAEARKEELRKQEIEPMKQRGNALEKEVELLKHKLYEMELLSRRRSIFDFIFWLAQASSWQHQ